MSVPPEVLVALIAMPPAILIALAQWRTSRSVGVKNGHGSLQDSLASIHEKMLLDDIDRAHGENRQRDLLAAIMELKEALAAVQAGIVENSERIGAHILDDEHHLIRLDGHLARLDTAVSAVHELIGEPRPNDAQVPLIPYVHDAIHKLVGTKTVEEAIPTIQIKMLNRALDTLKIYEQAIQQREMGEGDYEALRGQLTEIHNELRTLNGLTVGQMADADERRRIEAVVPDDRTDAEDEHMEATDDTPSDS